MEWQKDPAAPGEALHKVEIERKRWGEGEREGEREGVREGEWEGEREGVREGEREGEREGVRERGREYVVNHNSCFLMGKKNY